MKAVCILCLTTVIHSDYLFALHSIIWCENPAIISHSSVFTFWHTSPSFHRWQLFYIVFVNVTTSILYAICIRLDVTDQCVLSVNEYRQSGDPHSNPEEGAHGNATLFANCQEKRAEEEMIYTPIQNKTSDTLFQFIFGTCFTSITKRKPGQQKLATCMSSHALLSLQKQKRRRVHPVQSNTLLSEVPSPLIQEDLSQEVFSPVVQEGPQRSPPIS